MITPSKIAPPGQTEKVNLIPDVNVQTHAPFPNLHETISLSPQCKGRINYRI